MNKIIRVSSELLSTRYEYVRINLLKTILLFVTMKKAKTKKQIRKSNKTSANNVYFIIEWSRYIIYRFIIIILTCFLADPEDMFLRCSVFVMI